VHHVLFPFSSIDSAISPHIDTFSIDGVVVPFSNVDVAVGPDVSAIALLLGVHVVTLILAAINPVLRPKSMLLVILPFSFIF
jgi:hypothetical protein